MGWGAGASGEAGGAGGSLGRDQPGSFTPLIDTGGNVQALGDAGAGAGAETVAAALCVDCTPAWGIRACECTH